MSLVVVEHVNIVDPVGPFLSPFVIDIVFECFEQLKDDLEWKVIYVGSAESEAYDQELESVLVGPVPIGKNRFRIETPPPSYEKIPKKDRIGVTAILITCSYQNQEFFQVGYYVRNFPEGQEAILEQKIDLETLPDYDAHQIVRNVLSDKPRVTTFFIKWNRDGGDEGQSQNQLMEATTTPSTETIQ